MNDFNTCNCTVCDCDTATQYEFCAACRSNDFAHDWDD